MSMYCPTPWISCEASVNCHNQGNGMDDSFVSFNFKVLLRAKVSSSQQGSSAADKTCYLPALH